MFTHMIEIKLKRNHFYSVIQKAAAIAYALIYKETDSERLREMLQVLQSV